MLVSRKLYVFVGLVLFVFEWLSTTEAAQTLFAGGPGAAAFFDYRLNDLLAMQWKNTPPGSYTMEMWLNPFNPHVISHTIVDYSNYDTGAIPNNVVANEFAFITSITDHFVWHHNQEGIFQYSPSNSASLDSLANSSFESIWHVNEWNHWAVTFDLYGGGNSFIRNGGPYAILSLYRNGVAIKAPFIFQSAFPDIFPFNTFVIVDPKPLIPNGCFIIGQHSGSLCSGFYQEYAFSGLLDEFRVWNYVRSAPDISTYRFVSLPPNTPGLSLYYTFDDMLFTQVPPAYFGTNDITGNGNNLNGALPTIPSNVMFFVNGLPNKYPTTPRGKKSSLPLSAASGPIIIYIDPANLSTPITLSLLAGSTDTSLHGVSTYIMTPPGLGTISSITSGSIYSTGSVVLDPMNSFSKRVVYTPNVASFTQALVGLNELLRVDTFTYYVMDNTNNTATGTVNVYIRPMQALQPLNFSVSTNENTNLALTLADLDEQSNFRITIITRFPKLGKLYSYQPKNNSNYISDADIETDPNLLLFPITPDNPVVQTIAGNIIYVPPRNMFSSNSSIPLDSFEYALSLSISPTVNVPQGWTPGTPYTTAYRWNVSIHDVLSQTSNGHVYITVNRVNLPPVSYSQSIPLDITNDSPLLFTLNASKLDLSSSYAPHLLYSITSFPTSGTLYQYNGEGSLGSALIDNGIVPTVFEYASAVMGASSAYNPYLECLVTATCDKLGQTVALSWSTQQILGPPDVSSYGDSFLAWSPQTAGSDHEYIDLYYNLPVYVSIVEVYISLNPNPVSRISIAPYYNTSSTTSFTPIWTGTPYLASPSLLTFSPSVCTLAQKSQILRVELTPKAVPGFSEIDAIRISGTLSPPRGQVTDPLGRLYYVPFAGIHSAIPGSATDSFSYVANDCVTNSPQATISFTRPAPSITLDTASVFTVYNITAPDGILSWVTLDVNSIFAGTSAMPLLSNALSTNSAFVSVSIVGPKANSLLSTSTLYIPTSADPSTGNYTRNPLTWSGPVVSTYPVSLIQGTGSKSNQFTFGVGIGQGQGTLGLRVWITIHTQVYRTIVYITPVCRTKYVNDYTGTGQCIPCADASSLLLSSFSSSQINEYNRVCVDAFQINWASRYVIAAISCLFIFLATIVFILIALNRNLPIVKASSVSFVSSIIIGTQIALATTLILLPSPSSVTCSLQIWFGHLSFAFIFGPLFVKTYRVVKIFTNSKLKRRFRLSDRDLLPILFIYLAAVLSTLIAWQVAATPTATTTLNQRVLWPVCSSPSKVYLWVLIGIHSAALVWGIYLCIKARNIPSDFNESKFIATAIYNVAFVAIVLVPLLYSLTLNPDAEYFITSIGIILASVVSCGLVTGPNIMYILSGEAGRRVGTSKHDTRKSSNHDDSSAVPSYQAKTFKFDDASWSEVQVILGTSLSSAQEMNLVKFIEQINDLNDLLVSLSTSKGRRRSSNQTGSSGSTPRTSPLGDTKKSSLALTSPKNFGQPNNLRSSLGGKRGGVGAEGQPTSPKNLSINTGKPNSPLSVPADSNHTVSSPHSKSNNNNTNETTPNNPSGDPHSETSSVNPVADIHKTNLAAPNDPIPRRHSQGRSVLVHLPEEEDPVKAIFNHPTSNSEAIATTNNDAVLVSSPTPSTPPTTGPASIELLTLQGSGAQPVMSANSKRTSSSATPVTPRHFV